MFHFLLTCSLSKISDKCLVSGNVFVCCNVFVQSQCLPVMKGPVMSEATSILIHPHTVRYPPTCLSTTSSSWKNSITPVMTPAITPVMTPVVPMIPPPIVIAPTDTAGIPVVDPVSSLPHLPAASSHVEAPAVAMTTETQRRRISRAITGRGCRDQIPASSSADSVVSFYLLVMFYVYLPLRHST